MKWAVSILIFCICIGYMQSCATVINGTKQRIYLVTEQPGATVSVDGETTDTTPCMIKVKRSWDGPPNIQISKDSFYTENVVLKRKLNELTILNFINIFGWGIDAGTGSIWRYNQPDTMQLKPKLKRR